MIRSSWKFAKDQPCKESVGPNNNSLNGELLWPLRSVRPPITRYVYIEDYLTVPSIPGPLA